MNSFEAIEIPLRLLPEELWESSPEELAFLIKFGSRVCNSVERTYMTRTVDDPLIDSRIVAPSAVIGQTGEEYVYNLYEERYLVENVAKQGRAGDLFMWRCDETLEPTTTKLLVEVKNYQSTVASEQVDKFYRDLSANSSICGGIFISLNTKISGIGAQFKFCLRNRMPIVFVQSRDKQLLMMAAELIWSYIDSRTVIDEEAFQKLSRKLTRLNDTLNGMSLARTFVTETRTVVDKQLNRIYEAVFKSEMQMRAAISSISKTLMEFTRQGGVETSGVSGEHFSWDLLGSLQERYPNTAFADETHRETVLNLTNMVENKCLDDPFTISYDKKGVVVLRDGKAFLALTLLKTRTDFNLALPGDSISIPQFATFKNGMVGFSIDKKYIKSGNHEKVIDYLASC